MIRTRLPVLIVAVLAMLAPVAVVAVEYSVTTQQRVSTNRVPENFHRNAGVGDGWTGASAVFHWPVKWVRATRNKEA